MNYKGVVIECQQGDITASDCQAIVNAANNALWMGAGVAGAIKRKGGIMIEKEAVSKGPIEVGQAAVTSAGDLEADYVIHAAAMGTDLRTDAKKISQATYSALLRAKELNIESIAFPALGTGVGGFPLKEAAKIMIEAVKDFIDQEDGNLKKVNFVLFSSESFEQFKQAAE